MRHSLTAHTQTLESAATHLCNRSHPMLRGVLHVLITVCAALSGCQSQYNGGLEDVFQSTRTRALVRQLDATVDACGFGTSEHPDQEREDRSDSGLGDIQIEVPSRSGRTWAPKTRLCLRGSVRLLTKSFGRMSDVARTYILVLM